MQIMMLTKSVRCALSYTDEMLSDVENILTNAYESSRTKYENLLNALKGNLDIVINNKNELKNSGQEYTNEESAAEQTGEEYSDDDFNFDENTFLEDIE